MKAIPFLVLFCLAPVVAGGAELAAPFIPGFTEPVNDIEIGFSEAGRLDRIEVREGDTVSEGDLLLGLDNKIQELQAKRQRLRMTPEAELKYAEKKQAILAQQLKSAGNLLNDGIAISREEFESKELQYSQAKSELARLMLRRQIEETELELAREAVDRRLLHAPAGGTIAEVYKGIGESVVPHEAVVRLVDTSTGRFVGNAEVALAKEFSVGGDGCVRIDTPRGYVYMPATVTFLSSTVDTASDLMEVHAEFDNRQLRVRLGSPAELVRQSDEPGCE